jgi:hypothetical protein
MNPATLARHYDALTAWERLPLLIAAEARADEVESDRLTRSAPKQVWQAPDYWSLLEGLEGLAKLYLLYQLDGATFFWQLLGALEQGERFHDDSNRQREDQLWKMIKLVAHKIVVRADGWKLFCQELQVDGEFLLQQLPGSANLTHTEQRARLLAFSAGEAMAYLRELFERAQSAPACDLPLAPREYRLDTAADMARAMRETLNEHVHSGT